MRERTSDIKTLNSDPSLINRHVIFTNGVKGKILSHDENKNLVIFCNPISDDVSSLTFSFRDLKPTLNNWLEQSFDKNESSIYFENTRFSFSDLKEGECYDEINIENNKEIEYLDKIGSISYRQAINLGAKRIPGSFGPPEGHSCNFFDNMRPYESSWMSTAKSKHHSEHLTQSYLIAAYGMIEADDWFNGHQITPVICISGNVLYDGGTGSKDDPIKICKERLK